MNTAKYCTDGGRHHALDENNICFECGTPATPSQQAKAAGIKNLAAVTQITGVSAQTLTNWHRDKPELFRVVLAGCVAESR